MDLQMAMYSLISNLYALRVSSVRKNANRKKSKIKGWNHIPAVPINVSPLFRWPPRPSEALKWIVNSWFFITENFIVLAIALVCLFWFQPSLEQAQTLSLGWIAQIYFRNFVLLAIVAGGLHLYFYTFKKQGQKLKYDPRPLAKSGRQFTLGGQVRDNMFWSLSSGVFFWTLYEVILFWAMANGWTPILYWSENPVWFALLLVLTPIWISFHFYWIHRLLHWSPLTGLRMVCTTETQRRTLVGLSMHPLEHLCF